MNQRSLFTALVLAASVGFSGCSSIGVSAPSADSPLGIALRGTAEEPQQLDMEQFRKRGFCPKVIVRDGTQTFRVFTRGNDGVPQELVYQATISKTARECQEAGDSLAIKVGVAGRLIPGPKGKTGRVVLPLRVAVTSGGGAGPAYSKLHNVPLDIQESTSSTVWTKIDPEVFVVNSPDLVIYVGFDDQATGRRG